MDMTGRTIPNFFLIGPPKAGTTAVAETLSKHPEIFISDPKEPDFFVYQGGNPYGWDAKGKDSLDWYLGLFEAARSHTAVGDASPYYICCYHVAEQIYRFNPDARIIAILRNPVYRAFSMYRYWHTNSPRELSASDFIASFQSELLGSPFEFQQEARVGWLKDTGFYAKHLKRYLDLFPREQVKAMFYEDLIGDPKGFYQSIYRHLGVSPDDGYAAVNREINVTVERRWKRLHSLANRGYHGPIAKIAKSVPAGRYLRRLRRSLNEANIKPKSQELAFPQDRYAELIATYDEDITMLEEMLGIDLQGWRTGTTR